MIRKVEGPCLIMVQSTSDRPQNDVGSYLGPLMQNPFMYALYGPSSRFIFKFLFSLTPHYW